MASELEQLREELAAANKWKQAITDAAVCDWTLTKENENDPVKAVNDLLCNAQQIALDPQVSEDARKLRDTYKAERDKLRQAIRDAGFAVMQTSGKWSIHDVSEPASDGGELERLQQDRDAAIRQLADEGRTRGAVESERDRLRDENRRLRGALEWIRDAETHFYTEDTGTGAMRLPDLLRNWAGPLRSIFDTSRQTLAQPNSSALSIDLKALADDIRRAAGIYWGGHDGKMADAFHHGMETAATIVERYADNDAQMQMIRSQPAPAPAEGRGQPCLYCGGTGTVNTFDGKDIGGNTAENWPGPCPKCQPDPPPAGPREAAEAAIAIRQAETQHLEPASDGEVERLVADLEQFILRRGDPFRGDDWELMQRVRALAVSKGEVQK